MSLPSLSGAATIVTDPKRGVTSDNTLWCNAIVRFVGHRKVDGKWVEGDSFGATIAAYGDLARALARFGKGDTVAFAGRVKSLKTWTDRNEKVHPQMSIVLDSVEAASSSAPTQRKPPTRPAEDWPAPQGARPRLRVVGTEAASP